MDNQNFNRPNWQNEYNQFGNPAVSNEDKTAAVLTYFGLLGFIIALILHSQNKTRIGAFHMRQAIGLMITGMAVGIASVILIFIPILGWLVIMALGIGMLVLVIMGIVNAAQGKFAPVPLVGTLFEKMFGTAFD